MQQTECEMGWCNFTTRHLCSLSGTWAGCEAHAGVRVYSHPLQQPLLITARVLDLAQHELPRSLRSWQRVSDPGLRPGFPLLFFLLSPSFVLCTLMLSGWHRAVWSSSGVVLPCEKLQNCSHFTCADGKASLPLFSQPELFFL